MPSQWLSLIFSRGCGYLLAGFLGWALLFFALQTYALALYAIIFSFLIIVVFSLGYFLHLRVLKQYRREEELSKMKEEAELHMEFLNKFLNTYQQRMERCEQIMATRPGVVDVGVAHLFTARRIIDALTGRLDSLVELARELTPNNIAKMNEIAQSSLQIKSDCVSTIIDADCIPDLEPSLWEETVERLLNPVETKIDHKVLAAR